jgi:ribosomal protein S18 acetylase RimI-like enzyme
MKLTKRIDGKEVCFIRLTKLHNNDIEIEYLWTDPNHRSQGFANQLLKKAMMMADKLGVSLVGFIEPDGTGLSRDQEIAWLSKNGFQLNKRYDFGGFTKPVMQRYPKNGM